MFEQLKKKFRLLAVANRQEVSMRHKLNLYWISMLVVILAVIMLVLSIMGVFSNSQVKLGDTLELQQQNTVAALTEHMDTLEAQGISMSGKLTKELTGFLNENNIAFAQLNDNPELIAGLEDRMYDVLNNTLQTSRCSGVYMIIDVTSNTAIEQSDISRAGLYLRYSDLSGVNTTNKHTVIFRGAPEVARSKKTEMHNRWNLEFDTSRFDGYAKTMTSADGRLADRCIWTERMALNETWESVILLCVPILDSNGNVCGVCGIEISDMYFRLSYSSADTAYGNTLTVLMPCRGEMADMAEAMVGQSEDVYLPSNGKIKIAEGKHFYTYSMGNDKYLGIHNHLGNETTYGVPIAAVTMLPENSFNRVATFERIGWTLGFLVFLLIAITLSHYLSKRFVSPIVNVIEHIQRDADMEDQHSGIEEIDNLMQFVRNKMQLQGENNLPPNIEVLFRTFTGRVKTLTATERIILQYYIDGYDINQIAEMAFISVNTVKKHNTNINRKLEVSTREELLLYIDFYRRCGRIDEISSKSASSGG